jgi:hypothetical protein
MVIFLKNISHIKVEISKIYYLPLGTRTLPNAGMTDDDAAPPDAAPPDATPPDAAPPGASSPGVAPPELAPATALDSSEAAAPRLLVTAVPAAAAAAPRLAVKAAPTAAPVLRNKREIKYRYNY